MKKHYKNEKEIMAEIIARASEIESKGYTMEELELNLKIAASRYQDDPLIEWYIRRNAFERVIKARKTREKLADIIERKEKENASEKTTDHKTSL